MLLSGDGSATPSRPAFPVANGCCIAFSLSVQQASGSPTKRQAPALGGEELGVNVSEATVKGAADLKLVGSHIAKHEAGLNVLSPGVANVGGGLADSHLFDEEAAFSADGFDVFFEASGEAESSVESLGIEDALEHCLEVLCGLPLGQ